MKISAAAKMAEAFTSNIGSNILILENFMQFCEFVIMFEDAGLSRGSLNEERFTFESTLKRSKSRGCFDSYCWQACLTIVYL